MVTPGERSPGVTGHKTRVGDYSKNRGTSKGGHKGRRRHDKHVES